MKLQATVLPQNATDKTVAYATDAEGITVSAYGLVSWTDETPFGTYTVTATTVNGLTDTFELTLAGRNLLVKTGITKDYAINNTGALYQHTGHNTSPKIVVSQGDSYVCKRNADSSLNDKNWRIAFYDADDALVKWDYSATTDAKVLLVPNNTAYMRVSYPNDANVKLEQGNVATPYTVAPEDL